LKCNQPISLIWYSVDIVRHSTHGWLHLCFAAAQTGALQLTSVGSAIVYGPRKVRCSGANIIHDKEHFNNKYVQSAYLSHFQQYCKNPPTDQPEQGLRISEQIPATGAGHHHQLKFDGGWMDGSSRRCSADKVLCCMYVKLFFSFFFTFDDLNQICQSNLV